MKGANQNRWMDGDGRTDGRKEGRMGYEPHTAARTPDARSGVGAHGFMRGWRMEGGGV